MNLNDHGAACRCLLRLRENEGAPGITDASFIARFLPRYPEWRQRPGAADMCRVLELARALHLADRFDVLRDYDAVLAQHRAGHGILVYTERAPEQSDVPSATRRFVTLLVTMNEQSFTLWCPYPSGQSENLPAAARTWWERWLAIGLILHRVETAK